MFDTRSHKMNALLTALCLIALPAAGKPWHPPKGCDPFVTIQMKQCLVANVAKCGQGSRSSYEIAYSDAHGVVTLQTLDMEGRNLSKRSSNPKETSKLVKSATAHFSLSRLLSAGHVEWDYQRQTVETGRVVSVQGSEKLTGQKTIDGITLHTFSFDDTWTEADGSATQFRGRGYLQADWRIEIPGTLKYRNQNGESVSEDNSPVEFIFEGEQGFMSTAPTVGCGGS